jgi:ferredoxin
MPVFMLDNAPVTFEDGESILDAARHAGIEIPALCYLPGHPPQTSCFLCVVRVNGRDRLVPSCATRAEDGMKVESECQDVLNARRTAIELLLSDHLGDCVAPCREVCPAHMNMPLMNRQIAAGKFHEALITVKESIPLPAILGRICPELCEKGCRRSPEDGSVSICMLKRFVADHDLASGSPWLPECKPPSGKRVAIVGSGPAGLSAAWLLTQEGHQCDIYDDHDKPGGAMQYSIPREKLPQDVLDAEVSLVLQLGARFRGGVVVGRDISIQYLQRDYSAILLAAGPHKPDEDAAITYLFNGLELKADRRTQMTNIPGIFAAGAILAPSQHAIRSVAEGTAAVKVIQSWLNGTAIHPAERDFSVHIGKLKKDEMQPYMQSAYPEARHTPQGSRKEGFTAEEARREAARCLHCDCEAADGCLLRQCASKLGANSLRFRGERRVYQQDLSHPDIIFEPGKCIACGICIRIAAERHEQLGLAFSGRGFSVQARPPFGEPIAKALQNCAEECADACPTGALMRRTPL